MSSDSGSNGDRDRDRGLRRTTDPALARSVVEDRGGYPAHEANTEGQGDQGLLKIGRHGREDDLTEISWSTFAEEFEGKGLEFVYPADESNADEVDPVGELRRRSDR